MSRPKYIIERHTFGWLICGPDGERGVPADALSECQKLFPPKAVMAMGVPRFFHAQGRRNVIFAVATAADAKKWEAEIETAVESLAPQDRWFRGLHVGVSSAAIFAVFCEEKFKFEAKEIGHNGGVPRDAEDFGRCLRLLTMFPGWLQRLPEVATAYPDTKWPAIIARWDEICAAEPARRTAILNEINDAKN